MACLLCLLLFYQHWIHSQMIGEISVHASPRNPAENLWADCEAKPGHGFVQFARVQKTTPPVPVQCATSNRYIKLVVPEKKHERMDELLKTVQTK